MHIQCIFRDFSSHLLLIRDTVCLYSISCWRLCG
nr:MAG TPA: hypothetical protein [Caudoviricetes sp.]